MILNIVIPVTAGADEKEAQECGKIAESIWNDRFNINVTVKKAESVPAALNAALDGIKSGYVLFLMPGTRINPVAAGSKETADAFAASTGLLLFGYKKIIWNVPQVREGFEGTIKTGELLKDFHGALADEYYTGLQNKIFSVDVIQRENLRFNGGIEEYYDLDFILRFLAVCDEVLSFSKQLVTCYAVPDGNLAFEQRFYDKTKVFESFEEALQKQCGNETANCIMDEERLNYAVYEAGRAFEVPGGKRKEIEKTLYDSFVAGLPAKKHLRYFLKSSKERLSARFQRKNRDTEVLRKETEKQRETAKEAALGARLRRKRKFRRGAYKLFSKRKRILLWCESTTMKSHILDYYCCIKDMDGVDIYIYYPGNWDNTVLPGLKNIRSKRKAFGTPWNLVVCADAVPPFSFAKEETRLLYINHGLHMISYDGGENLYAYAESQGRFTAMLEPNKSYAAIMGNALKDVRVVHTGYKNAEKILKAKDNAKQARERLGIPEDAVAVAVFGTWGKDSLFHRVGEALIARAKALMSGKYAFILSIHPKEYTVYDETVEPLGKYVDSLAKDGFIIRDPKEPSVDYMIAADVVICDYSSLCEEAMLAGKPVIMSDFPDTRVWKHSVIRKYKEKGPVFRRDSSLEELLERAVNDKKMTEYASELTKDLLPHEGGYAYAVRKITEELL